MDLKLSTVIGGLVVFIILGTIGTYVASSLVTTMNLSVATTTGYTTANYTHQSTPPGTPYAWTVPTGVTSISFTIVGAGGGGGSGNSTDDKGGAAGYNGSITTVTSLAITPGTVLTIKHGLFGAGGVGTTNGDGTAAGATTGNSSITIGTILYNALGGAGGLTSNSTNVTSATSGMPGLAGWRTTGSAQVGDSNKSAAGGDGGTGFGAGGGGGASASWVVPLGYYGPYVDGSGGRGENGGTQVTYSQTLGTTDPLYTSQQSLIATFELGIDMIRILVIISIIVVVWLLLQQAGIVPRMAPGVQWYQGGGPSGPMQ